MFSKIRSLAQALRNAGASVASVTSHEPPKRGTRELQKMYSTSPWLRAVVNKIGKEVGTTPWRLYRFRDTPTAMQYRDLQFADDETRTRELNKAAQENLVEPVYNHRIIDLLFRGNRDLPGQLVFQILQQHYDLVGETFLLLERNQAGVPVEIWPLPPEWIYNLPNYDRPYYEVNTTGATSASAFIPPQEIIHIKDPDPSDPYSRGSGIGFSLGDELEIDEYAAQHVKSFFYNRARPDIIVYGDGFTKDEADRVETKWKQNHQGFFNQFKPMFINRKVEIKELSQTFENLQMSSMRAHERDTIIECFGVPPEKLGVTSASNRSTIEAGDRFWHTDVIRPRVDVIRNYLQRYLVPMMTDEPMILDYYRKELVDTDHIESVMRISPYSFTHNDFRKAAGYPSWGSEGDVRVVPENMTEVPVEGSENSAIPSPRDYSGVIEGELVSKKQLAQKAKALKAKAQKRLAEKETIT